MDTQQVAWITCCHILARTVAIVQVQKQAPEEGCHLVSMALPGPGMIYTIEKNATSGPNAPSISVSNVVSRLQMTNTRQERVKVPWENKWTCEQVRVLGAQKKAQGSIAMMDMGKSSKKHSKRGASSVNLRRFWSTWPEILSIYMTLSTSVAMCMSMGRLPKTGVNIKSSIRSAYFACLFLLLFNASTEPSMHLSETFWNEVDLKDARILHQQTVRKPNVFQADSINSYSEFGNDKVIRTEATRYYCRCLDLHCFSSRILLRSSSQGRWIIAVDSADPYNVLNCGDFIGVADPMQSEAENYRPNLPLGGVFLNDSGQGAEFNSIPLSTLQREVHKGTHDFIKTLWNQRNHVLSEFIVHKYQWRTLRVEVIPLMEAAGLTRTQSIVRSTNVNLGRLQEGSALWIYREKRDSGGVVTTHNGTISFGEVGIVESEEKNRALKKQLNMSVSFAGEQIIKNTTAIVECNLGSDFVPDDRTALYKLEMESLEYRDEAPLETTTLIGISEAAFPAVEAELSVASREAPTPSSMTEAALAVLAALTSVFGDPINASTGFFISRFFRWNRQLRQWKCKLMRRRRGHKMIFQQWSRTALKRSDEQDGSGPHIQDSMKKSPRKLMKHNPLGVVLALCIVVLPDLIGFALLYTPLALITVNEYGVNTWSHTTYDTSVRRIPHRRSGSVLAVITQVSVTTTQKSSILGLILPIFVILFVVTMSMHCSNVVKWLVVVRRSYCGVCAMGMNTEGSLQDAGWFETWLCGVLEGVHDNLKRSHTDIFNELYRN